MRVNYRKIWEQYYKCCIVKGYEVHHIDGDHTNNNIENLMLVTTEEHLQIHVEQEDWGAVQALLMRIESDIDISDVASKAQRKRWDEGRHNFQAMTEDRRREVSSVAGQLTRDLCVGIHAINADPIKAKENGRRGGLKAKELCAGFLNTKSEKHGSKAVKGTYWWTTKDGSRKRSKECPGEGWVRGTTYKEST